MPPRSSKYNHRVRTSAVSAQPPPPAARAPFSLRASPQDLFAAVGGVESAEIVVDESGRSRCEATSHAAARFGCVPPVPTHVK